MKTPLQTRFWIPILRENGLVAGDCRVYAKGPCVDAASYRLGLVKALLTEPRGDRKGAISVVAKNQNEGVFIELLVGAGGDFVHGQMRAAFDARRGVLPGFTHVEEEWRLRRGEMGVKLVDRDFEVHTLKITGSERSTTRATVARATLFGRENQVGASNNFCSCGFEWPWSCSDLVPYQAGRQSLGLWLLRFWLVAEAVR